MFVAILVYSFYSFYSRYFIIHYLLFIIKCRCHSAEEHLADGHVEVVACGVEVGGVVLALEVLAAELGVANTNHTAVVVVVEHRDVLLHAYLVHGAYHLLESWTVDIPRCDISYLCIRVLLL